MKFSSEPPTAALFFVGKSRHRDQKFRARSKISIEIKNFDRDQFFLIVGPSGTVGTSRRGDMVLRSRSPRKCHYPLFAYPLFKRALYLHSRENKKMFPRRYIPHKYLLSSWGQIHLGANTCRACIRTRAQIQEETPGELFMHWFRTRGSHCQ